MFFFWGGGVRVSGRSCLRTLRAFPTDSPRWVSCLATCCGCLWGGTGGAGAGPGRLQADGRDQNDEVEVHEVQAWDLCSLEPVTAEPLLAGGPVSALLAISGEVWAAVGGRLVVLSGREVNLNRSSYSPCI